MCDGIYGRPDLKGRVLVGYDSNQKDYNKIGNNGGLSHVSLKTEELPEHTHTDSGHSHFISLKSSYEGSHSHDYNSNSYNFSSDTRWKSGHITKSYIDHKVYTQVYTSSVNGNHNHNVNGESMTSYASISRTGNNEKHENRQPYSVVAYIVYLG